jgi:hypothetical protein
LPKTFEKDENGQMREINDTESDKMGTAIAENDDKTITKGGKTQNEPVQTVKTQTESKPIIRNFKPYSNTDPLLLLDEANKIFSCAECGMEYATKRTATNHIRHHHAELYNEILKQPKIQQPVIIPQTIVTPLNPVKDAVQTQLVPESPTSIPQEDPRDRKIREQDQELQTLKEGRMAEMIMAADRETVGEANALRMDAELQYFYQSTAGKYVGHDTISYYEWAKTCIIGYLEIIGFYVRVGQRTEQIPEYVKSKMERDWKLARERERIIHHDGEDPIGVTVQ